MLESFLERGKNNLDLMRLVAALMVLYGHSYVLTGRNASEDLLYGLSGYYSAEIGLKMFFLMSGLLIVNTLLKRKNSIEFVIHRFFRIMPGLLVVSVLVAFVLGPMFSANSVDQYFQTSIPQEYVVNVVTLKLWGTQSLGLGYYELPGVFENNSYPKSVNGPLWTLSVEVYAYMFMLAAFLTGLFRKDTALILFLVMIADSLLSESILFPWLPDSDEFKLIPFSFAVGGVAAIYKNKIRINFSLVVGLFLLYYLFLGHAIQSHLIIVCLFALMMYISTIPIIVSRKISHDLSYGIYIYAWPVQQVMSNMHLNVSINLIAVVSITVLLAYFSWIIVEKPSINLGKRLCLLIKK